MDSQSTFSVLRFAICWSLLIPSESLQVIRFIFLLSMQLLLLQKILGRWSWIGLSALHSIIKVVSLGHIWSSGLMGLCIQRKPSVAAQRSIFGTRSSGRPWALVSKFSSPLPTAQYAKIRDSPAGQVRVLIILFHLIFLEYNVSIGNLSQISRSGSTSKERVLSELPEIERIGQSDDCKAL